MAIVTEDCEDGSCNIIDEDDDDMESWDGMMMLQQRAFLERPVVDDKAGLEAKEHADPGNAVLAAVPTKPADTIDDAAETLEAFAATEGEEVGPVLLLTNVTNMSNATGVAIKGEVVEVASGSSGLDIHRLATIVMEGGVLILGELLRRAWVSGVVEATNDIRCAVVGFPLLVWLVRKGMCRKEPESEECPRVSLSFDLLDLAHGSKSAGSDARITPEVHDWCVLDLVGCALEHCGGQQTAETVEFRSVAINAAGLAYTALGRPVMHGTWRLSLLGKENEDNCLIGVMAASEVAVAAEELAGHWAFVGASCGRGFGYAPQSGRAVRRGVETPCVAVDAPCTLELELDAERRCFEVFRVLEDERELLCAFAGIKHAPHRLAISLRKGSIAVMDLSTPEQSVGD